MNGTVTFASPANNVVRQISLNTGKITTVAGTGTAGFVGDGGLATTALLQSPTAVALDAAGDIYVADSGNSRVRRVDASSGNIYTVAGVGTAGYSGDAASALAAQLNSPPALRSTAPPTCTSPTPGPTSSARWMCRKGLRLPSTTR